MINTAEEFVQLRTSYSKDEQARATYDTAEIETWNDIIGKYPTYKEWAIHNKTIPNEILEILSLDADPRIRSAVARKRSINDKIIKVLSVDLDVNVRQSLLCNTGLTTEELNKIKTDHSDWLKRTLAEALNK
jgi:hypothetical protein